MDKTAKARCKHSPAFKSKVALEALKERETLSQLGVKYNLNPVQITQWKKQLLDHSSDAFVAGATKAKEDDKDVLIQTLYTRIGQYQVEPDWLKKNPEFSLNQKRLMIASNPQISIRRQCELLDISRSGWYYKPLFRWQKALCTWRW